MRMRPVFYREAAAHMYHRAMYGATIVLAEMPGIIGIAIVFSSIFYWMAHFKDDAGAFFFYMLAVTVCLIAFVAAALVASAFLPNVIIAQISGGVFLAMAWAFADVFEPINSVPIWWRWVSPRAGIRYSTNMIIYCN